MDILVVISRLLDYPDESLYQCEKEISRIIWQSEIESPLKDKMQCFLWEQLEKDILDWQAEYDGMFERGRSLGLWLFEHVHGESRDRGQAMVDLMEQYKQAGLQISRQELPDYIPLFLEFVATQEENNAKAWLQDVEHILALLQSRLEKRGSGYAVLFQALLDIAGSDVNLDSVREQVQSEKPDNTQEALDKEWQEEEVTFGAESLQESCGKNRRPSESQRADLDVPVHWVDFKAQKEPNDAHNIERNS